MIPSCGKKIKCPGFPETYLIWMPYLQGEEFSLTDGIDAFQFSVTYMYIPRASTITKLWPMDLGSDCDDYAECTITSPKHVYSQIRIQGLSEEKYARFSMSFATPHYSEKGQFFGFQHNIDNNVDTIFATKPYQHVERLSSFDNGYKIYDDVLKFELDTLLSNEQIYQIYYAKNIGFIQIKDRFNHKTWSLIE
jgi:hypothetical protein